MNIKPIRTKKDYQNALKRIDNLMDAELDTPEGDELEILAILVERYEEEEFPIDAPDPISAIRFRLEQLGMEQADFARIVGANRASEILSGQRAISLSLIKRIHHALQIPYENLLGDNPKPSRASSH
jgi:HTH-type transcriptional regulator/antitoxin HigA